MESKILAFIEKKHPSYQEILNHFSDLDESLISEMLLECEKNGLIDKIKSSYYVTSQLNEFPACISSIKDSFAFAKISDEEEVYISMPNLKNAFLGDYVLIKKISNNWSYRDEYEVIKVTRRMNNEIVGRVETVDNKKVVVVEGLANPDFIFLLEEGKAITNHQWIRAKVDHIYAKKAMVFPLEILGKNGDVGLDVSLIILKNQAPLHFPDDVLEQVKTIPSSVSKKEFEGRENFLDHLIVTIDGVDAKDFDDAVEVQFKDGIYHVGVHIADVAHYVKENSPIDKEALNRATSLYVQDRVVPMLPFELSNGICSLNPHENRLVTSCLFTMNQKGTILSTKICKGVIRSSHRLTYTYVNQVYDEIEQGRKCENPLEEMLIQLHKVSLLLRKKRTNKGGLSLETTELKFTIDEKGEPTHVDKREQKEAENTIEDLMIAANEIVASTIEKKKLPMVYRVHGRPKAKKLDAFIELSEMLGIPCNISSLTCKPKDVANYLESIEDERMKKVLSSMLLRCLAKAKYQIINEKHFGLASSSYTHFTSPIRRYPDLLVHRLIDRYLIENDLSKLEELRFSLSLKCTLSSQRERRALTIERSVDDLLSAKLMKKEIGNEYDAVIVSLTSYGMYVEIDNGIQGLIRYETITGDYYELDATQARAYGYRKRKFFSLGDVVHVILSNVDTKKGRIEFVLFDQKKLRKGVYGRRNKSHR